jgi:hypothetical protein
LDLLNSCRSKPQVTTALSLIHTLCNSLQQAISLLSVLCLHRSLRGYSLLTRDIPLSLTALANPRLKTLSSIRVRVSLQLTVYHQSVRLDDKSLRLTTTNFIFQLNACGYCPYVKSSLTRGRVCSLQFLLVIASAVILRFDPAGLMTTFYCLRFETPLGTGWSGYTARHWVPFSSPSTTRRATVEVFDPASRRDPPSVSKSWCPATSWAHGQIFITF